MGRRIAGIASLRRDYTLQGIVELVYRASRVHKARTIAGSQETLQEPNKKDLAESVCFGCREKQLAQYIYP